MALNLLLAWSAGLLTILSPCVLPVLPIIVGSTLHPEHSRWHPVWVVLGFVAAFTGITITFSAASHLLGLSPDHLRHAAIASLLVLGWMLVWPSSWHATYHALHTLLDWLRRTLAQTIPAAPQPTTAAVATQPTARHGRLAHWGGFGVGLSLGAVWAPCAGPVLGSVLVLLATTPHPYAAALQLLAFAVGAGLPMLAIAYSGRWASARIRWLTPHLHNVQRFFGVVIMATAWAMYKNYDIAITTWLAHHLPSLAQGL